MKENERDIDLSTTKTHCTYPDPEDISLLVEELSQAKAPVIIAGGESIWWENAEKELQAFSSGVGIPVFNPTWHIKIRKSLI